jgi:hypothetical protein
MASNTHVFYEDDAGMAHELFFDVISLENHDLVSTVTEHPVETGSNISDHTLPEPQRFTLEGYISDTPIWSNPGINDDRGLQPDIGGAESVELPTRTHRYADGTRNQRLNPPKRPVTIPLGPGAVVAGAKALFGALTDSGHSATLARYVERSQRHRAWVLTIPDFESRFVGTYEALRDIWENSRVVGIVTSMDNHVSCAMERAAAVRRREDGNGATFTIELKEVRFVTSETVTAPLPAEALAQPHKSTGSKASEVSKNIEGKNEKLLQSFAAKGLDALKGGGAEEFLSNFGIDTGGLF